MGSDYTEQFITGITHVFKTMCAIDLAHESPFEKAQRRTTADVTGVMAFTGDRRGTMCFNTSASGALTIYARLMHEKHQEVNAQIIDAVGELTNIISGQARKELEKESLHLIAHVPMVFVGKGLELHYVTKGAIVSIPFSFDHEGKTEELSLDYVFE